MERKFPKNIFQVWIQGCEDKTIKDRYTLYENKNNWKLLNDDWNYTCLSDIDLLNNCIKLSEIFKDDKYLSQTKYVYDYIFRNGPIHLRIDFGRYVTLYLYGGIYTDMDAYILRSLSKNKVFMDNIVYEYEKNIELNSILGLSLFPVNMIESIFYTGKTKMFNNAVMISSSYNEILKELIKNIIKLAILNQEKIASQTQEVDHDLITKITGPIMVNKFINKFIQNNKDFLLKNKIVYFNNTIFEPCAPFSNCNISKDTISIHQMEMTWLSSITKNLIKFYYYVKNNVLLLILIFSIIFIYFYFTKCKNKYKCKFKYYRKF